MKWLFCLLILTFELHSYAAVKKFDIGLFYGYNDQHPDPYAIDNFQLQSLIKDLTKPCKNEQQMICGFRLQTGQLNTLTRRIQNVLVTVFTASSSYTTYDPTNRSAQFADLQKSKSFQTKEFFLTSLKHFDATFYVGHARFGSGPDFFILDKDKIGKKPKKNFSAINEVIQAVATNPTNPHIYLLACDSELHWKNNIKQRFNKSNEYYVLNSIIRPQQVDLLTRQLLDRYLKMKLLNSSTSLAQGVVRLK